MRSARSTIQKNLPRNNTGSRNQRPCPNPHIMEMLSFFVFALTVVTTCTASVMSYDMPDAFYHVITAQVCSMNDTIYRVFGCRFLPIWRWWHSTARALEPELRLIHDK